MKWVQDKTGRFATRPHYLPEDLDDECERIIRAFLQQKYGKVEFPIKTDDLTILIEQTADLDAYADLSADEGDVQGVTEFTPGKRPVVRISETLQVPYLENRLRTTLTHEWGHVHFHKFMFEVETRPRSLFGDDDRSTPTNANATTSSVLRRQTGWNGRRAMYAARSSCRPAR